MKEEIIQILSEIRPEIDFTTGQNFIEEGKLDSLDIIRLVAELDAKYAISIGGNEIVPENFISVEAIQTLVIRNKQ